MSKYLDRASILAAEDRETESVSVPEWGGDVMVRTITAGERDRWELSTQRKKVEDIRGSLVALTVCDEEGNLLFSPEDVKELSKKSSAPMQRIFNAAVRINRISNEDVSELEKN